MNALQIILLDVPNRSTECPNRHAVRIARLRSKLIRETELYLGDRASPAWPRAGRCAANRAVPAA